MMGFNDFYNQFVDAKSQEDIESLTQNISIQGYSFINEWILQLEKEVKWADEEDFDRVKSLLDRAEQILPEPEKRSPLWEGIWGQLISVLANKKSIYKQIPASERINEWQVVIENPHSTEGITNHVRLSFPEAAYLYAKYRKSLSKREYLTLQRVQTFLTENGEQGPSLVDL